MQCFTVVNEVGYASKLRIEREGRWAEHTSIATHITFTRVPMDQRATCRFASITVCPQAEQAALETIVRQSQPSPRQAPRGRRGSTVSPAGSQLAPGGMHPQIMVSEASIGSLKEVSFFCAADKTRRGSAASIGPIIIPVGDHVTSIGPIIIPVDDHATYHHTGR